MTFKLPGKDRKWIQTNASDLFGTVSQTKGVDFDAQGYISLAKRVRSVYDANLNADFGRPVCIVYYPYIGTDDYYYVITDDKIFSMVGSSLVTAVDASTDVPTVDQTGKSDAVIWQNNMYVSCSTYIAVKTSTVWDATHFGTLSSGGPMCVFKNKNSLAVGNNNTVQLYDTSHALTVTLTVPTEYYVTSMDWSNNFMYIGTRHRGNGDALLFQWDGSTTSANNGFSVGTHRIDSVKAYKDSVAIVTSDGRLQKFNGGGFDDLGELPVYYTDYDWDVIGGLGSTAPLGRVLHRGMVVENDLIFINLSGAINVSTDDDVSPAILNSFPSGVWCYDPKVGLYHRYALCDDIRLKTDAVTTSNVDASSNIITVAGVTVPATGTPVLYDDGADGIGTGIVADGSELLFRRRYYTVYLSNTTFKLASTYENALAGVTMDITGAGNNSQYFVFEPNRDFGGIANTINGAVCLFRRGIDPGAVSTDARRIIFGGSAGKTTTTMVPVLNVAAEGQENRGYFITPKLFSSSINDVWQNVTISFKNVQTPEDKVVVKFRTAERSDDLKYIDNALTPTGTWSDANTFTSTDFRLADAQAGDEVEIVRGAGSGYLAHITSISENGGTYTVNIDESVQNITASDTMLFFVDNWSKLKTSRDSENISTSDCETFTNSVSSSYTVNGSSVTFPIGIASRWIQFKVELRGEDIKIEDILVNGLPFHTFVA